MGIQEALIATVAEFERCGFDYDESVKFFKRQMIVSSLERNKGNQCRTARELGMHRNTLTRTINELKLVAKVAEIRQGRPHWRRPPRSAQREQRSQPMAS